MRAPALRDVLVALTTFAVVGAVLVHVLVAGQLAATVPSTEVTTRATAVDATVLDRAAGKVLEGVTLQQRRRVAPTTPPVPDLDAYVVSTSVTAPDGTVVRRERWNGVQERFTGLAVPSVAATELATTFDRNGDAVEERRPLRTIAGVLLRFPRDTPATDRDRWDPATSTVGTARFEDETRLAGRRVLRFRQQATARTDASTTTSDTRLWVRPETGAVVRQVTSTTIRLAGGETVLDARFVDDPRDVRAASDRVDDQVRAGRLAAYGVSGVLLVVGVLALVAAVVEGGSGRLSNRWRRARDTTRRTVQ